MKDSEKLLSFFRDYLKEVENDELKTMVDGVYIFVNALSNLHCKNESLFKINSFPRKVKNLIIEMEISTYEEIRRRRGKKD